MAKLFLWTCQIISTELLRRSSKELGFSNKKSLWRAIIWLIYPFTWIIAIAGLITGIAASFSMAASEYLSTKSEGDGENALSSSIYTGIAYIFTVIVLILPYFLFTNYFICLGLTMVFAVLVILFFNYYIAVAKDLNFRKRFWEMFIISMGVAAFTFGIGYLIRVFLGIEV